jgi:hypothetical protein
MVRSLPGLPLTLALRMPHGDAVRMTPRSSTNANNPAYAFREERTGSQTEHAAHARANARIQLLDVQ